MPALASASESSFDELDSDWDLDALIGGSSSEGSADERVRSRSPAPHGVCSTRAAGRRMIAGTPAERRGWLQRDLSLERQTGDDRDDDRVPQPEVDDDYGDGSIGDGSVLDDDVDAGALADHDSDGCESDTDGSVRGEDADLEVNGFAADLEPTERGFAADADTAQAGVADGVAIDGFEKLDLDAAEVARESRRAALAAAAPAGAVAGTCAAHAGGRTVADPGGFGKPFKMPGPPVVCRTTGCGRSGRNQSNRHDTECCVLCTMSGGAEHTEECDGRSGVGPEPTAAAGGLGTSMKRPSPPVVCRTPGCGRSGRNQSDRHDTMCCDWCENWDGELHTEECDRSHGVQPDPDDPGPLPDLSSDDEPGPLPPDPF